MESRQRVTVAVYRAYHGSQRDFKRFNRAFRGGFGGTIGIWFASTPEAAAFFAKPKFAGEPPVVFTVDLLMYNPYVLEGHEGLVAEVKRRQKGGSIEDGYRSMKRAMVRDGHDGIIIRNCTSDSGLVRDDYVVFNPKQVEIVDRTIAGKPPGGKRRHATSGFDEAMAGLRRVLR